MKQKNGETSTNGLRTWLEIDRKKVAHNYRVFRNLLNRKTKLMSVVKSNAYGHDLYQFAKLQEKLGADWLGVDSIVEGEALRQAGIRIPILVLGYTLPEKFKIAQEKKISLTVSTLANLKRLKNFPKLKFHLKIDTGMHRQGFLPAQIPAVLKILKQAKIAPPNFEGLYTHFAAAKNPAFPSPTLTQLTELQKVKKAIFDNGFTPICHAAATAGTIVFPASHLDLVRVGIGLYGLYPSPEVAAGFSEKLKLQPVLTWQSIIGEVKTLPADAKIGYDWTETLSHQVNKIAILPVGYWHGYPRALSSLGHAIVNGKRTKVLGRISMDMIILDVRSIKKVREGDLATLLGKGISAEELGTLSGSINYEIVTRLNPLLKRIYR